MLSITFLKKALVVLAILLNLGVSVYNKTENGSWNNYMNDSDSFHQLFG